MLQDLADALLASDPRIESASFRYGSIIIRCETGDIGSKLKLQSGEQVARGGHTTGYAGFHRK